MPATRKRLLIEQGATWSQALRAVDVAGAAVNLTGYTVRMQIREPFEGLALGGLLATPTATVTAAATGDFTVSLTAAETEDLTPGPYVYDIEIVAPGGAVDRIFAGDVDVEPEVTRT